MKTQPVNNQLNDQEKIEKKMPAVIVNQASVATIAEESFNRNQNFLTASSITIHNTIELALKLNHFLKSLL